MSVCLHAHDTCDAHVPGGWWKSIGVGAGCEQPGPSHWLLPRCFFELCGDLRLTHCFGFVFVLFCSLPGEHISQIVPIPDLKEMKAHRPQDTRVLHGRCNLVVLQLVDSHSVPGSMLGSTELHKELLENICN